MMFDRRQVPALTIRPLVFGRFEVKAFVARKYQKNSPLECVDLPKPIPQPDEILIQINSSALNVLDAKIRDGEFKIFLPYKTPVRLGHDLSGKVVGVGASVTRFKVGDEVFSRPRDFHQGTFAEFISTPEADVSLKPKSLNMDEAAGVPLVSLTAWQALVEIGKLRKGQRVFIQAGSGGVGTVAIQIAKDLGAYVATTASARNRRLMKELGADEVIDYKTQDFEDVLSNYDLVLHSQDSKTLLKSLRVLRSGGTLVSITGPPTADFAKSKGLGWPLPFVMSLLSLRTRLAAKKLGVNYHFLLMRADGGQLEQIANLIDSGRLKPVVDRIFPFEKTNEALEYIESGRATGKVIISIQAE